MNTYEKLAASRLLGEMEKQAAKGKAALKGFGLLKDRLSRFGQGFGPGFDAGFDGLANVFRKTPKFTNMENSLDALLRASNSRAGRAGVYAGQASIPAAALGALTLPAHMMKNNQIGKQNKQLDEYRNLFNTSRPPLPAHLQGITLGPGGRRR